MLDIELYFEDFPIMPYLLNRKKWHINIYVVRCVKRAFMSYAGNECPDQPAHQSFRCPLTESTDTVNYFDETLRSSSNCVRMLIWTYVVRTLQKGLFLALRIIYEQWRSMRTCASREGYLMPMIRSAKNSDSSKSLWLSSLPASLMKSQSKMMSLSSRQYFPNYMSMGD